MKSSRSTKLLVALAVVAAVGGAVTWLGRTEPSNHPPSVVTPAPGPASSSSTVADPSDRLGAASAGDLNVEVAADPPPAGEVAGILRRLLATSELDGVEAATSFGVGYVQLSDVFATADLATAMDAQRRVASPGAGDRLAARLRSDRATLARSFPEGGITYRTAPAGVHTTVVEAGRVEVSVWYVVVRSSATVPPAAVWHTTQVTVVRTPAGWRGRRRDHRRRAQPGV